MPAKTPFNTIDDYIQSFPAHIQNIIQEMRATILAAAPDAQEKISYDMPTFTLGSKRIYFAAWKKHIALYGIDPIALEALKKRLAPFQQAKGSLHFPLDKPLPTELISQIVKISLASKDSQPGYNQKDPDLPKEKTP